MLGRRVLLVLFAAVLGGAPSALAGAEDSAARVQQMYAALRDLHFPGLAELDPRAARALAESVEVVWLDVRTERERRVSVIRGALDLRAFRRDAERFAGRPVIVYCTIGHRSGLVTRELRAEGFEAHNLAGGILAWIHAEGELVDPSTAERAHTVHVYGPRWNLVPPGWRSVW